MFINFKNIKKGKNNFWLYSKNGEGFTLIELIVTIAIISILSVIILYSVTQYIGKGKDKRECFLSLLP